MFNLKPGNLVIVRMYGGKEEERRVVAALPSVVVVCSEDEYRTAGEEGREPSGIGFPRNDVRLPVKEHFAT